MCCVLLCCQRCCCHFNMRVSARTFWSVVFYMFFHRDSDCCSHILNLSWNSSNSFELSSQNGTCCKRFDISRKEDFQICSFVSLASISWQRAENTMYHVKSHRFSWVLSMIIVSVDCVKEIPIFFHLTFQRKWKEVAEMEGMHIFCLARTCLNYENSKW